MESTSYVKVYVSEGFAETEEHIAKTEHFDFIC